MTSILLFSTGVFLFLWHASDTFAWGSNNDIIDFNYWNINWDGSTGMIADSLYGDGLWQTDKTFYTQYWNTHLCDPDTLDVQYIAAGTDTLPATLAADTIYVLATGDHNMSYSMDFAWDCTAVLWKSEDINIIARVKYLPSADSGVLFIDGNRNIIISNIEIKEQTPINANAGNPTAGVYITNSNANTIWPWQWSNASYGIYVEWSDDITIGWSVGDNPYGHYVINSDDINIGTPRPVTLPWTNGTWVYVGYSTNVTIDADPRQNTSIGVHVYQSTGIWMRSRYISINSSPGTLIENVYNGAVNGAHGGNLGYWLKILNSYNITGTMPWPILNSPVYYGINASDNIGADAHGLIIQSSSQISLTGIYVSSNDGYGAYIDDSSDVSLGYFTALGNTLGGLYVSDSENISVNRASITGNLADGVYMVNTSGAVIYSGYIAQNSDDGIHASWLTMYHTYTDNDIYNNDGDGIQRNASTTDMSAYNTIDGNDIGWNDVGLRMQWQGSQLTDNTISNNDIHDSDTNGIYMNRWYFNMFDNNFVYNNGAKGIYFDQTVGNTITGQNVYGNAAEWLTIEWLMNNHIYSSYFYDNGTHGVYIYDSDDNNLSWAIAYQNAAHGIFLQNANNITIDKSMTFGNNSRGLHIYQSFANTISNLQTFSNVVEWLYIDASTGNIVHNVMTYNNGGAGIGLYDNANYNTINNVTSFSQQYGIALQWWSNNIIGNVFNTINIINNVRWIYIDAGATSVDNVFNDISTIHNNTAVSIVWGTNSNLFYGAWFLVDNDTNFDGTGAGGILDAALSAEPNVLWPAGYFTILTGSQWQMTCNYAVQVAYNGSNLLDYPYCDTRDKNTSWTGWLGVEYTFFPNILKQANPVYYDSNNDLDSAVGLEYHQTMFAGDYAYLGDDMIGWYIELDETWVVAYQSGWFVYTNYPNALVGMITHQWAPNYINTWVWNILYDGLTTTFGWTFQTPLLETIWLPLVDQEWLKIVRTSYDDGSNISNYYGFILWLAYDDISITKTASTWVVQEWAQIWFTITIHNSWALAGTSQVFDFLPRVISETGLQTDPAGTYSGDLHGIIWDMPEVAEDTTYTFTITWYVETGFVGESFVNTGYFISDYTHSWSDLILYSEATFDVISSCWNYILQWAEQCDDGKHNKWTMAVVHNVSFEIPQTCGLSGNLVPNPWFESYIQCPTNFSHFTWYAASWYSPSPNADYMDV
jgi:parallel beta-helix repeat protein